MAEKKFVNPTAEGRSKKAHTPRPPRKIAPKVKNTGDELEIGQFTRQGGPALEKK